MDYQDAIREVAKIDKFFRCLKPLSELLELAQEGKEHLGRAEQELQRMKAEASELGAQIRVLTEKRNNLDAAHNAEMKAVMAEVQKAHDAKVKELSQKIAEVRTELNKLLSDQRDAVSMHKRCMEEFEQKEKHAKAQTELWEARLTEAKKKYEDFKKGL